MGMAASQARFLGLTARKNNVEFEGQQINQQRTTLSNQSANYYNDLLGMAVPVPPSVDDYTKTVYTFEDGALTNQVTAMIAQNDGTYKVSYLRQWTDDFSVVSAATSIVNKTEDSSGNVTYRVGAKELRGLCEGINTEDVYTINGVALTMGEVQTAKDDDDNTYALTQYTANGNEYYLRTYDSGQKIWYIKEGENQLKLITNTNDMPQLSQKHTYNGNDEYLKTLSENQLANLLKEEREYIALLTQKYGGDENGWMVRYVQNTTTEEWNPYFYKKENLKTAIYDDNGNSQSNINCYKVGSETKTEEVKAVADCKIEKDSSGRYINITIPQHDENGNKVAGTDVTYALTTSTVTDQDKYEDAMNQYEYEKYEYDQAIQEINAKIEIIQSEDKNLELRLKQLDTEQKAISTEVDAVSQVIQKNTESSFKTFG